MARDPYRYFRLEARELVDQLGKGTLGLEKGGSGHEIVPQLLRLAHTLKGAARVVKLTDIAESAHAIESLLEPSRASGAVDAPAINEILSRLDGIGERVAGLAAPQEQAPATNAKHAELPAAAQLARVDVEQIDELVDGITEISANLNALDAIHGQVEQSCRLAELLAERPGTGGMAAADRDVALAAQLRDLLGDVEHRLGPAMDRMQRDLRQLRELAEQARLVPAASLFTGLERTARDAAQALGKRVDFAATGGAVRLDPRVLGPMQEALTQLIRNAVAHGIEAPSERVAAGKPEAGRIGVTVLRSGRRVTFRCTDDGSGIDLDAVRRTALASGMSSSELKTLGPDGLARLILRGGFTTSPAVTEIAGRGIGMDIVSNAVKALGGEVAIRTEAGQGTTIDLVVPLSLSSIEALAVEAGGLPLFIPLEAVQFTHRIKAGDLANTPTGDCLVLGDRVIPFVPLERILPTDLQRRKATREGRLAVVIATHSGAAAIGVDRLEGTAEVVLRTLPELAPADPTVAGATFDIDGQPRLVLEAEGLVAAALAAMAQQLPESSAVLPVLVVDDSLTTRMLEQSILESAGYRVDVAASAEEGLERARAQRYALFLVDVEMPGMDGFAFIERIRADASLQDIPAILVTSLSSPESVQRGAQVGAQGYMVKSEFDQPRLLAQIRQLTERTIA